MQICDTYSPKYYTQHTHLQNSCSAKSLKEQNYISRSPDCSAFEHAYWRSSARWILKLRKRTSISKSTLYLAISYLARLVRLGCTLNESNYEKICAALVLMSAKMNEIYPPKMNALINRCSCPCTKDDLSSIQSWILSAFNFDMSFTEISYSYLAQFLGQTQDRMEDSQKLLGLAVSEWDILKEGEEMVALAVIYLIKPSLIRECNPQNVYKLKNVASKLYNLYILNKTSST